MCHRSVNECVLTNYAGVFSVDAVIWGGCSVVGVRVRYKSNDITDSRSASEPIMYGLPEILHRREEPVRMHADIIAVTEA